MGHVKFVDNFVCFWHCPLVVCVILFGYSMKSVLLLLSRLALFAPSMELVHFLFSR